MFTKNTLMAAVAAAVAMFLVAWLLFGVVFGGTLAGMQNPALQAAMSDMPNMALLFVAYVILAWMMAYIFPFGYRGGSQIGEGFRFGVVIWLLASFSQALDWQSWGLFGWDMFLLNEVLYLVQFACGGIVIAMIASNGQVSAEISQPVESSPVVDAPDPEAFPSTKDT